jgi:NAD(P)-dependent dehydrogenase (short-subunit alcohol dehydrogenase family)
MMPNDHSGPIAVIAGVGSGLGASLARRFAREGYAVALFARSSEFIGRLAAELCAAHGPKSATAVPMDLGSQESIRRGFERVRAELGRVEVLVNNAAAGWPGGKGILEVDPEFFESAWRVGALSSLLCSQEAARDMLDLGQGTILFTGATSSVRGSAIEFSSAKFAARGLAQALARELWPRGIHVAHVLIDGIIAGSPDAESGTVEKDDLLLQPDAIAEAYWQLAHQERSAWTFELDLRPHREKFFE